jgi:hypothetical protein
MITQNDYREMLKKEFERRCLNNESYSLRSFARHLHYPSEVLSKVISGSKNLSIDAAVSFCDTLNFKGIKREEFIASVRVNKPGSRYPLTSVLHKVISDPIHHAILNAVKINKNLSNISKTVNSSESSCQTAIENLITLGLLEKEHDGYKRIFPKTASYDGTSPEAQKNFHRKMLAKASESLELHKSHERNISGLTMAIDPANIEKANKEIARFRERLCKILEEGTKTKVYHLEIGLFPYH